MQITAMANAAETAAAKEPGMAAEKAAAERDAPFSNLLEGLIKTGKEGQDQELEPEDCQEETTLTILSSQNSLACCPSGMNLATEGNDSLVISEDANDSLVISEEANDPGLCQTVSDTVHVSTDPMPQIGMQAEASLDELADLFAQIEDHNASGQNAQTKDHAIHTDRQIPMDQQQPLGQRHGALHQSPVVNVTEGMGKEERKEHDLKSQKEKLPEIKVFNTDGVEKAGIHYKPKREEGSTNREDTQIRQGSMQHKSNEIASKADTWNELGPIPSSQRVHPGQANRAIENQDIINQMVDKMKIMLGSRKTEISIQLKPESLGKLNLRLTVTDGVLNGRIIVQNDQTKSIIQSNLARLQENLEQQGIPVNKLNVNVGGGGEYRQQQFFQENRQTYHGKPELHPYQQKESHELEIWRGEGTIELLA